MRTTAGDGTQDEPLTEARRLVWVPLVLLGLAWGVLVPVMTAQAALATVAFFGETASAADHLEQHRLMGHALAVSASLAVTGLVVAVGGRSTGGGWVFALLLLPTLVIALLWLGTLPPSAGALPDAFPSSSAPTPAASHPGDGACQEYSGGDTRCPGG